MGRTNGMHRGNKNACKMLLVQYEVTEYLEELGIDGRIIFRLILMKE
jgi:hypothetical protein